MGKRDNVKIIMDGFNAETPLSDDDMLQKLYEAGVKFSELRTVFNDIIKEKGLRLTTKERKLKTIELMGETKEIKDADEVLKIVSMLEDKLKVVTTKAMGSLRTWCKDNNVTLPKTPKVSKPRKVGFGGHYAKILNWILSERETSEESVIPDKKAVVAFCHKSGIPEAYSTQALNVVHFAQRYNGEIVDEPEAETEETAEA